jgi:hypothetical protein
MIPRLFFFVCLPRMGNEPGIFYFAFRLFLNFGAIASPWFHVFFVENRFTDRHLFDTRTVESHYSGVDEKMRSLLCCQSNIPWPNCHSAEWFSTKKTWIIHGVGRLLALIEKPARDEQLFLVFPGWGANYGYFS